MTKPNKNRSWICPECGCQANDIDEDICMACGFYNKSHDDDDDDDIIICQGVKYAK